MKIKIISSREEIDSIETNEDIIHFSFRPSNIDIMKITAKCPQVRALQIPSSYMISISKSSRVFLDMKKVALLEGDVWGHRKDICEYSEISPVIYERIAEYRESGLSNEEIKGKMVNSIRLSPDLLAFILEN